MQQIRQAYDGCTRDLSRLRVEKAEFHSAEKVSRNDRLAAELSEIERVVKESQVEMERVEGEVGMEEVEIEGIEGKIREVKAALEGA